MNLSRVCMAFITFLSLGLSLPLAAQPKGESARAPAQVSAQAPAGVIGAFKGEKLFRIQAPVDPIQLMEAPIRNSRFENEPA